MFTLQNKNEGGDTYVFGFDFRYYRSYQGDQKPASGAYIFRPDDNYQRSFRYSELYNISSLSSDLAKEFHLMFDYPPRNERAFVKIRLYEDSLLGLTPEITTMLFQIPLTT